MLALESHKNDEGFSVISTEEMLEINGGNNTVSINIPYNVNGKVSLNVNLEVSGSYTGKNNPVKISLGNNSLITATAGPFSSSVESVSVGIKIKY